MIRIGWLALQHYTVEIIRAARESCHAWCLVSLAVFLGGLLILLAL
jgi:hypothetical protein